MWPRQPRPIRSGHLGYQGKLWPSMRAKPQPLWPLWQVRGSAGCQRHGHGHALAGKAAMVWQQGQAKRSEYSMSKAQLLA